MLIKDVLLLAKDTLKHSKIDTYSLDAELLLAHILGMGRLEMLLNLDRNINKEQKLAYNELIKRRHNQEPIAYILGYKDFWDHRFLVAKDTLIPRPETELIIEEVLEFFPDKNQQLNILDLGVGTGCIIISLLHEYRNAHGVGVDINQAALEVAKKNAQLTRVQSRLQLVKSNWFENINGKFDIIVSNPPYIGKNEKVSDSVRKFEPKSALFSGEQGIDSYREIACDLKNYLSSRGMVFLEIGAMQGSIVSDIIVNSGLKAPHVVKDLAGLDRVLCCKVD